MYKRFELREIGSLVSNMVEIGLDYPILDRRRFYEIKFHNYVRLEAPQCNWDFMNKIEVRSNIVPPSCPCAFVAFIHEYGIILYFILSF